MCTLTIAWQAFADAPVVVAANRDESVDRPSEPPMHVWTDPDAVAPRDAEAGGTWIGYNEHGVFAGVTNRWVEGLTAERSRGLLVTDCLEADSAEDAARRVEAAVRADGYDGFNLVVADDRAAVLLEWDGHLRVTNLDPSVHVVVNVGADGYFYEPPRRPEAGPEQADSARRLRDALQPEAGESADEWLDRAGVALADHDFGVCVHEDGYGTVSSSLLALGADGDVRYDFASGPPCETAHEPVTDLVRVEWASGDGGDGTGHEESTGID